jgi:hypothetical protein
MLRLDPNRKIEITVRKLVEAFKLNELQADNMYKGKTLKVTGKVVQVRKDFYGKYYIEVEGESKYRTIDVYVQDSQLSIIANLTVGQTVTVIGQCDGYRLGRVYIRNSIIQD